MIKVVTNEQMRQLDEGTTRGFQVPGLLLMERASLAIFQKAMSLIKTYNLQEVLVVAGPGNNGGDGLATARHLEAEGVPVKVLLLADPEKLKGDTLMNHQMLTRRNLAIETRFEGFPLKWDEKAENKLIIDAIFGTGLTRLVEGVYKEVIEWINYQPSQVLSVDIPSGIAGNSGCVLGTAVKATHTISFQLAKIGNVCYPGATYNGELQVVSIGIPQALLESTEAAAFVPTMEKVASFMPLRESTAHKGTFGSLLVIGGTIGYTGAGVLAAMAAQRSGVGLVKTAVRKQLNHTYEALLPEAVTVPLEDMADPQNNVQSRLSPKGVNQVKDLAAASQAVVAGPGWGRHDEWHQVLENLIQKSEVPLVLDADALNLLSPFIEKSLLRHRKVPVVLTPHPGEMARLINRDTTYINNHRLEVAARAAMDWGAVVVLKGAGTIIASPEGYLTINNTGNQGMAKGGSGDVLSGIIGALMAQGVPPYEAAVAGCWIHGKAGDLGAAEMGFASLAPRDIIEFLPKTMQLLYHTREASTLRGND